MDFENELKDAVRRKFFSQPNIHIGSNALSGKKLFLSINDLASTHTYIPGSSGVGKSKFLERIARDIIKSGHGLIIVDGKGDLYDNLLDFCSLMKLEKKVILIDPNEDDYSVGINYLEPMGETTPEALAGLVLEGLMKFFKEDKDYKPWLEEWAPASLTPLIKSGFTLLELFYFVSQEKPEFREAVLKDLGDGFYKDKWQELTVLKPFEQSAILNVVRTRASKFWEDHALKSIFGQKKTSIDWLKVMNEGGIVLAKLGRTPKLTEKTASLIGAAILHQVTTVAPLRPQGRRSPCFFMIDEFQKFVTSDFSDALDRMRGYGIPFILAHQHRSQLEKESPEILNSIDSNCRNKFVFAISRQDADDMALELFTGMIHKVSEEIKSELWQTKLRPIKTYETVETDGNSAGQFAGATSSTMLGPDGEIIGDIITESSSSGETLGTSHSTSKVPWYDYEEYQEVSSRTYYSIEEVKERFISWVKNQSDRHAQWKFKDKKPIPIITPTVKKPAAVLPSIQKRFKEKIYSQYTLPKGQVIQEIEGRVKKFLEEKQPVSKEPITYRHKKTKA